VSPRPIRIRGTIKIYRCGRICVYSHPIMEADVAMGDEQLTHSVEHYILVFYLSN